MISCVLAKKINADNICSFVYEGRYRHFYVEVTGKMTKELQGCLKKKITLSDSAVMCIAEIFTYC